MRQPMVANRERHLPKQAAEVAPRLAWALAKWRTIVSEPLYWVIFVSLTAAAIGVRAFWIYTLEIPFVTPDTPSYLSPVIVNWTLPFSQSRTGGTSAFIALALAVFRDPIGILIINAILAVGSAALLALAIKTVLHLNLLSLIALFSVAFTAKNVSFEYYLMSEHYARVLYVVYAALVLWLLQKPSCRWLAVLLGLVVALNILVKPSAIVLAVATIMALVAVAWLRAVPRLKAAACATMFLAAVIVPLVGYMGAFKARYSTFSLTQYDGINQFSHIGHLIQTDAGKHPMLKERLRPLIESYAANYASKEDYQPNWLVFGTASRQVASDFGDQSPARAINEYVREMHGSADLMLVNKLAWELSVEAILARPATFAKYSVNRALALWTGYSFRYYEVLPSASAFPRHREHRALLRKSLYEMYGETAPVCGPGVVLPVHASGIPSHFYRGAIGSCANLPYENPAIAQTAANMDALYLVVTRPLANIYEALPKLGAIAAVVVGLLLLSLPGWRVCGIYGYGTLLLLVLFGYTVVHAVINVAELTRMTANVQDFVVVGSFAFILCVPLQLQRLLRNEIVARWRIRRQRP